MEGHFNREREREKDQGFLALVIGRGAQQRARESEIRPFFAIVIGKCSTESEGETERGRAFFALVIGGYSIESERERGIGPFFAPEKRERSWWSERLDGEGDRSGLCALVIEAAQERESEIWLLSHCRAGAGPEAEDAADRSGGLVEVPKKAGGVGRLVGRRPPWCRFRQGECALRPV